MSLSLIYGVAQLRGMHELSVKNPGRLLAQKRCVAQMSCPHSLFFLLEQGRRKKRPPGQLGRGLQEARQTPRSPGRKGSFLRAEPPKATAPALAPWDEVGSARPGRVEGPWLGTGDSYVLTPLAAK